MLDLLTPEQASEICGVPAVQLERWAFMKRGPKNSGTKWRPKFRVEDVEMWKADLDLKQIKIIQDVARR